MDSLGWVRGLSPHRGWKAHPSRPEQHRFYCGVDLHARRLSLCILDVGGRAVLQIASHAVECRQNDGHHHRTLADCQRIEPRLDAGLPENVQREALQGSKAIGCVPVRASR